MLPRPRSLLLAACALCAGGLLVDRARADGLAQPPAAPSADLAALEKQVEVRPDDVDLHVRYQDQMLWAGKRSELRRRYGERWRADPKDPVSSILYGRVLGGAKAVTIIEKALERRPDLLAGFEVLASVLEQEGRYAEAAGWADSLARARGTAADWNRVGWLRERSGRTDDALKAYAQACEEDASFLPSRLNRSYLLARTGKADEALALAQETARRFPADPNAHIFLGLVLSTRGDAKGALGSYQTALRQAQNDARALLVLATTYASLERLDLAREAAARARRLAPQDADAAVTEAFVALSSDDLDAAEAALVEATRLDGENARAHQLRGYVAERRGNADQAITHYKRSTALEPENGEAWVALGRVYESKENWKSAEAAYAKAVDLRPKDASPRVGRALALQRLNRAVEAAALLEEAAILDPKTPETHLYLGVLYADALSNADKAIAEFKKYRALGGKAPGIEEWIQQLGK